MVRGVKIAIAVVALLSIGAFLSMTRGIAALSIAIQDSVPQLDTADTSANEVVYL